MAETQGDSSAWTSPAELLALHAVRLGGVAHEATIVERYGLEQRTVDELMLDDEAYGWVTHVEFADVRGWTLTESGRSEDTGKLLEELDPQH